MSLEWIKDCKCKSPATIPQYGVAIDRPIGSDTFRLRGWFKPGPVCDQCGKPWRRGAGTEKEPKDG